MMLHRQGIDVVVLEARDKAHVRARVRAGVIEQATVDTLTELGVAGRLHAQALRHNGFYLRFDRHTHHLDFHRLTGRNAFVYGQAEIVADLIDARTAAGLPLVFDAADVEIGPTDGPTTELTYTVDGRTHRLTADFVAGCDGFHGVSRTRLPSSVRTIERVYPFAWLGILARTTPVTEEGMYCAHPDGLSVHNMRGTHITRQYLQVPADTDLADWPDERIWAELRRRSGSDDHPDLQTGEIFDRSLAPLRSVVTERMQHGSLFLLGDAAHIVPPTGAKGLNLAVSDASVLSHALGVFYRDGDRTPVPALGRILDPGQTSLRRRHRCLRRRILLLRTAIQARDPRPPTGLRHRGLGHRRGSGSPISCPAHARRRCSRPPTETCAASATRGSTRSPVPTRRCRAVSTPCVPGASPGATYSSSPRAWPPG